MSNPRSGSGNNKTQKRNLPSWMSSSESGNKKDAGKSEEDEKTEHSKRSAASGSSASDFSKLLEGVVFVLSGFVNPERSILRSKAIEMGAAYQADWNSDCTLLVCAFPNTPKFRQVEADCGTIVSKEWILECYNQMKLVDIDNYLMHAGKPWRKSSIPHQTSQEESPSRKSQKGERGSQSKPTPSSSSKKSTASNFAKEKFSPTELKKWAADDLIKTISWLESQEEKPEQSEIKQIAAEGILTCLQDAIDSLEQKRDVRLITEQWQCVPRVVEELAKLEVSEKGSGSRSKVDLCTQAKTWKRIYDEELHRLDSDTPAKKKKPKTDKHGSGNNGRPKETKSDAAGSDSEETVEMTEEEIELAYQNVTS